MRGNVKAENLRQDIDGGLENRKLQAGKSIENAVICR